MVEYNKKDRNSCLNEMKILKYFQTTFKLTIHPPYVCVSKTRFYHPTYR